MSSMLGPREEKKETEKSELRNLSKIKTRQISKKNQ